MQHESRFFTVENLAKKYQPAGVTKGGIRWLLFNRETNGFARCVVRVGRKIMIDDVEYVSWLRDHREVVAK